MRNNRILRKDTTNEEAIRIYVQLILSAKQLRDTLTINNKIKTYVKLWDSHNRFARDKLDIIRIEIMDDLHDRGFELPRWCHTSNKNIVADYKAHMRSLGLSEELYGEGIKL